MKIRNVFVSNSSSSSFVVFKGLLSDKQRDMILDYQTFVKFFNSIDEKTLELFDYCSTDPWQIVEYDDFIFGETSMDNFSMQDYFDYIKIDENIIKWDDGYVDEPYSTQLDFIKELKKKNRKIKLDNINDI